MGRLVPGTWHPSLPAVSCCVAAEPVEVGPPDQPSAPNQYPFQFQPYKIPMNEISTQISNRTLDERCRPNDIK